MDELKEKSIYDIIKKAPEIKSADIAKLLGFSVSTINRIIGKLKEKGYISREGSKKNGVWVILK